MNLPNLIAIATLGLAMAPASQAAVVFSSGAPANNDGYNFGNPSAADDFTLTAAAQVNGVEFWAYSNSPADLNTIGWAIMSNNAGLPGAVLFSGLATASSVTDTGVNLSANSGLRVYDVQFPIAPAALLANTTYWLALDSDPIFTNGSTGGFNGWVFTSGVAFGGSSAYGGASNGTIWSRSTSFNLDSAFRLSAVDLNVVPEPASLALVGLALAGLAATGRRSTTTR